MVKEMENKYNQTLLKTSNQAACKTRLDKDFDPIKLE